MNRSEARIRLQSLRCAPDHDAACGESPIYGVEEVQALLAGPYEVALKGRDPQLAGLELLQEAGETLHGGLSKVVLSH